MFKIDSDGLRILNMIIAIYSTAPWHDHIFASLGLMASRCTSQCLSALGFELDTVSSGSTAILAGRGCEVAGAPPREPGACMSVFLHACIHVRTYVHNKQLRGY